MRFVSLAAILLGLAFLGCGGADDTPTPAAMIESSHDHYHIHAADASHGHLHRDGAKLGHDHSHQHSP